jgi:hypothetical protein
MVISYIIEKNVVVHVCRTYVGASQVALCYVS